MSLLLEQRTQTSTLNYFALMSTSEIVDSGVGRLVFAIVRFAGNISSVRETNQIYPRHCSPSKFYLTLFIILS